MIITDPLPPRITSRLDLRVPSAASSAEFASGLEFHIDARAEDAELYADTDPLDGATDLSGNGVAVAVDSGKEPTYSATGYVDGGPAYSFDRSDPQYFKVNDLKTLAMKTSNATGFTLAMRFKPDRLFTAETGIAFSLSTGAVWQFLYVTNGVYRWLLSGGGHTANITFSSWIKVVVGEDMLLVASIVPSGGFIETTGSRQAGVTYGYDDSGATYTTATIGALDAGAYVNGWSGLLRSLSIHTGPCTAARWKAIQRQHGGL